MPKARHLRLRKQQLLMSFTIIAEDGFRMRGGERHLLSVQVIIWSIDSKAANLI